MAEGGRAEQSGLGAGPAGCRPAGHVALRHRSPIYRGAGARCSQFAFAAPVLHGKGQPGGGDSPGGREGDGGGRETPAARASSPAEAPERTACGAAGIARVGQGLRGREPVGHRSSGEGQGAQSTLFAGATPVRAVPDGDRRPGGSAGSLEHHHRAAAPSQAYPNHGMDTPTAAPGVSPSYVSAIPGVFPRSPSGIPLPELSPSLASLPVGVFLVPGYLHPWASASRAVLPQDGWGWAGRQ